jgi:hypothetical protein
MGISTYSTALVVTRVFARPAVSYQPHPGPAVRSALYEFLGIPLARGSEELASRVREAAEAPAVPPLDGFLFNEGASLDVIEAAARELLDGAPLVCDPDAHAAGGAPVPKR